MLPPSEAIRPTSPPKARLTFRIGIVGHRPNRLKREEIPTLTARLAEVLSLVKKAVEEFLPNHPGLYDEKRPACLRAITPLAEGTDRYFAVEALRLGYGLCCPLPFQKEEFENDFKPDRTVEPDLDSVAEFNRILKEAEEKTGLVMFELDGSRSEASEAYAAAGRVVLNQSDLLLVVWDGEGNNKRGGTYETFKEAVGFGVPVLWVDARVPHGWQLLLKETELPTCSEERRSPPHLGTPDLKPIVDRVLGLPAPAPVVAEAERNHAHPPDLRVEFFAEQRPKWNSAFVWKFFRDLVGSFRPTFPKLRVPDFEDAIAGSWPTGEDKTTKVERWVNARLGGHYAWSDKLADFYADKYRSAFVMCYLYGALAVMLALLPHSFGWAEPRDAGKTAANSETVARAEAGSRAERNKSFIRDPESMETICSVLELLVVSRILYLVGRGNKRHWHDRWMAYRLIAELVRQLRFLIPLGGGRPFARPKPHETNYGNPTNSWMYWHFRAIDREIGLPPAKVTAAYVQECLEYVKTILKDQIKFHQINADRSKKIEHRLHRAGLFFFWVTAVVIAFHVLLPCCSSGLHGESWHIALERVGLTFICASLPAIGAAVAGISNQGEFARIARRSSAMEEQLSHLGKDLERLMEQGTAVHSSVAASHALRIAQTMVDEVLDWRVVFLDRPLVTPG
jgi:hypothetical protein